MAKTIVILSPAVSETKDFILSEALRPLRGLRATLRVESLAEPQIQTYV